MSRPFLLGISFRMFDFSWQDCRKADDNRGRMNVTVTRIEPAEISVSCQVPGESHSRRNSVRCVSNKSVGIMSFEPVDACIWFAENDSQPPLAGISLFPDASSNSLELLHIYLSLS
jgi:hypothetical protein